MHDPGDEHQPVRTNRRRDRSETWRLNHLWPQPCSYCSRALSSLDSTVDHVVPLSRRGRDHPSNMVLACAPCNVWKGSQLLHELPDDPRRNKGVQRLKRIFHGLEVPEAPKYQPLVQSIFSGNEFQNILEKVQ
jgi:5-methylcytosine-specific restriction endonuclease McrA